MTILSNLVPTHSTQEVTVFAVIKKGKFFPNT